MQLNDILYNVQVTAVPFNWPVYLASPAARAQPFFSNQIPVKFPSIRREIAAQTLFTHSVPSLDPAGMQPTSAPGMRLDVILEEVLNAVASISGVSVVGPHMPLLSTCLDSLGTYLTLI